MKTKQTRFGIPGRKRWTAAALLALGIGLLPARQAHTTEMILPPGDVDGDRQVTVADARRAISSLFGIVVLSGDQMKAGDLNGDGAVDLKDVVLILQWSMGRAPASLQPPSGQKVLLKAHAVGVQIYACAASATDPAAFAWTFQAPQADLFDPAGHPIVKHYAGPTWEAIDGSTVVGTKTAGVAAPTAGAIPWLLLMASSHAGTGTFSPVTYVQRLYTSGGNAPATGCDAAHAGDVSEVPYQATYVFYSP